MSELKSIPLSSALLRAQTEKPEHPAVEEPCVLPPEARYRGTEDRLYRVEVHRGGSAWKGDLNSKGQPAGNADKAATFKCSRDNGSAILAVKKTEPGAQPNTTKVTLTSLGAGCEISLAVGDWVEVVDDRSVLMNEAKPLLEVIAIEQIDRTVTLDGVFPLEDQSKHPLLRRWDFKPIKGPNAPIQAKPDDGALLIKEGKWLTLENGIQICSNRLPTVCSQAFIALATTGSSPRAWRQAISSGRNKWTPPANRFR